MIRKGNRLQGTGYRFRLFFLILLFTVYCLLFTSPTYAAESTPSSDLQTKLKALQEEIASRASQIKNEIIKKIQDKAYIGTIKSRSANQIILTLPSGEKTIRLTDDTLYSTDVKSKTKLTKDTLKEGDFVSTLGDLDDHGMLVAKKLIKQSVVPTELKKDLFWGHVVSSGKSTLTLESPTKALKSFTITPQTLFFTNSIPTLAQTFDKDQTISVLAENLELDSPKVILVHYYSSSKVIVASPSATPIPPTPTSKPKKK